VPLEFAICAADTKNKFGDIAAKLTAGNRATDLYQTVTFISSAPNLLPTQDIIRWAAILVTESESCLSAHPLVASTVTPGEIAQAASYQAIAARVEALADGGEI
jgi:hypothetical protein